MNILNIAFIGIGLAVDASCVCTSNGLVYKPKLSKIYIMALPFAFFQGIMPIIGYFASELLPVAILEYNYFIVFLILSFLGVKMIYEALSHDDKDKENNTPNENNAHNTNANTNTNYNTDENISNNENINTKSNENVREITKSTTLIQVFATSIDALLVGVILNHQPIKLLLTASIIIASITFIMCSIATWLGKKIGTKFNTKAETLGGLLLVFLAVKILIDGL